MTSTPPPSLAERIAQALSDAGAFCGECGFEPGETGCPDCVRVREVYADALLAVVQPELAAARAAGMRDAAAMLRRYCPKHDVHGGTETFMSCHCPGADAIDRDADNAARTTTS